MPAVKIDRKFWGLLAAGFFTCLLIPFLGAPILRVIRNVYRAQAYWLAGLLLCVPLMVTDGSLIGILIFSHWVMIGIFAHFEEKGQGGFYQGLGAILVSTLITWQGPVLLQKTMGLEIENSLQENLVRMVETLNQNPEQKEMFQTLGVSSESLLSQLPAILGILFLMGMGSALIFDRRVALMFGVRFERIVGTPRLLDFKVPSPFIWVFLASLALGFIQTGISPAVNSAALNVLHFLVGVYFFQGLAITETALLIFRVGPIMKSLFYILIVGQLFFLLSLVGLADFWLDLRQRLRQKSSSRGK